MSFDGPPRGVHGYPCATHERTGLTQADYDQTYGAIRSVVHDIMDAMGIFCPDVTDDQWMAYVQQAIWWHPTLRKIHPGEFDQDKLEQEAIDTY